MRTEHSTDIDATPASAPEKPPIAGRYSVDEAGEASFPASDPPSSWTWDVGGRPPGSATAGQGRKR
jgi:hypothetical protein